MGLTLGQVIDGMASGRIATTLYEDGNTHFKMVGKTIFSSIAGEDAWDVCSFEDFLTEVPLGLVPDPDTHAKFVRDMDLLRRRDARRSYNWLFTLLSSLCNHHEEIAWSGRLDALIKQMDEDGI